MPKSSTAKGTKKRVNVKDLPNPEKKMNTKEMKKVRGGLAVDPTDPSGNTIIAGGAGVGSLRTINSKPGSK